MRADLEKFRPGLMAFARKKTGNREDAEDLVQEALIAAHRAIGKVDEDKLAQWLMRTIRNGYIDSRRKRVVPTVSTELLLAGSKCTITGQPEVCNLDFDDLNSRFHVMPEAQNKLELEEMVAEVPEERMVIYQMKADGYTQEEIANATGNTVPRIKYILRDSFKDAENRSKGPKTRKCK